MSYECPICKTDINDLVSFQNLIDQYDKEKILFCPECSVGLQLNYDEEYYPETNDVYEHWFFTIKCLP